MDQLDKEHAALAAEQEKAKQNHARLMQALEQSNAAMLRMDGALLQLEKMRTDRDEAAKKAKEAKAAKRKKPQPKVNQAIVEANSTESKAAPEMN